MPRPSPEPYLRAADLVWMLGVSPATFYRMVRAGEFPKGCRLRPRVVVWRLAEVLAWIESKRSGHEA